MEILVKIFGLGPHLTALQMACRGLLIFFVAFGLIRLSGRRSFGMRTPLDNIIAILLGAILSRAVVGSSPLIPVFFACLIIVSAHRLCGRLISQNKTVSKFFEGEKILLFHNGEFLIKDMKRVQVSQGDIMQWIRKTCLTEDLSLIDKVYMEKNGEISATKKKI